MTGPGEVPKKRRRWPWVVLAALVLLVGSPIAWRYRPLNKHEREVLGRYYIEEDRPGHIGEEHMVLKEDRSYVRMFGRYEERGTWDASEDTVTLQFDFVPPVGSSLLSQFGSYVDYLRKPNPTPLGRDGDDLYMKALTEARYRRVREIAR